MTIDLLPPGDFVRAEGFLPDVRPLCDAAIPLRSPATSYCKCVGTLVTGSRSEESEARQHRPK